MTNEAQPAITDRMLSVLQGIAAGLKNHEIGTALKISPKTVEKHRGVLYGKFKVDNAVSLVMAALRAGHIKL